MELQHINVKIPVEGELPFDPVRFIDVFHQWIKEEATGELLIDVADYRHVPAGPGVLLVGHEADYSMDNTDSRWGLRYNRKAPLGGTNEDRFRQALASAANACQLLEERFASDAPLKFSRQTIELFVNDRALAPNTRETLEACTPDIEAFFAQALAHSDFTLTHQEDARARFGITLDTNQPFDLAALSFP